MFTPWIMPFMFILIVGAGAACQNGASAISPIASASTSRIVNLHAFARLYGVVRWFHPSDAASSTDWDQFAVDGARQIINASNTRALRAGLVDLFAPIAPTVRVVIAGEHFPKDSPRPLPNSDSSLDVVYWQHKGYGDSTVASGYISKRRHREREVAVEGAPFAMYSQSIDAKPYQGLNIRLRGKLRTANHAQGRLWLRVDRGDSRVFYESMARRPVMSKTWRDAEIIGSVDATATRIVIGTLMAGSGTTWYDDIELAVQAEDGNWRVIKIQDGEFENLDALKSWHSGTSKSNTDQPNDGWTAIVDHSEPASGASSLRVQRATTVLSHELFDANPVPDETVDIDLGSGLRARVPLALYSKAGHTLGDEGAAGRPIQAAVPVDLSGDFDIVAGVADVIIVWNVLEHFWPYWNVVSVDWISELDKALADALDDHSVDEHVTTLQRLSAAAPDDHASTSCPGTTKYAFPPFATDLVENQVVVTASADPAIERGDVIISIDGRPVLELLSMEEALVSGSPQWRQVVGLGRLGRGRTGSTLALRVRRGGADHDLAVSRLEQNVSEQPSHPAIKRFDDGVYYVDLERASMASISASIERLVAAPGVVFDMRVSPNSNHELLSHLLSRLDNADAWMAIPLMIRPDSASSPISWETSGWKLPVLQPHISGRVAFLTGPNARSYAESVMGLVEHYRLGEIVGSATAGTNGDIAQISEPTGCTTIFTGRRVTKLDGSRHHLIGIQPTIRASRTLAGVLAGRDEVLERALAYVRDSNWP